MERELQQSIQDDCPIIFASGRSVSVGKGWYQLVRTLCLRLEALAMQLPQEAQGTCYVSQIKEKYGGLRFYMDGSTTEMEKLIGAAERESYSICEACGAPGKERGSGWIKTLCDRCDSDKENRGF